MCGLWTEWAALGLIVWFLLGVPVCFIVGRHLRRRQQRGPFGG